MLSPGRKEATDKMGGDNADKTKLLEQLKKAKCWGILKTLQKLIGELMNKRRAIDWYLKYVSPKKKQEDEEDRVKSDLERHEEALGVLIRKAKLRS